jgi:hypothetical protein
LAQRTKFVSVKFQSSNDSCGWRHQPFRDIPGQQPQTVAVPEYLAAKRPFAACGKLATIFMEPSRTAGSAQMPLNIFIALFDVFVG